jgi:hypothetical protein
MNFTPGYNTNLFTHWSSNSRDFPTNCPGERTTVGIKDKEQTLALEKHTEYCSGDSHWNICSLKG